MLLLHQVGSVNVGQIARYTVTYTPNLDRILPPPTQLYVKIKNTSAIPLRAAYLHGPYTLYVACYPSTFDPYKKHVTAKEEGEPDYEPQLKAGGSWSSKLSVPESARHDASTTGHKTDEPRKSFTWIIEIASQVLFSTTATVHYELLVGRDEKSVSLGFTGAMTNSGAPGRLEDHQQSRAKGHSQNKGVFTKAIKLKVDDTASLWSSPAFPSHSDTNKNPTELPRIEHDDNQEGKERPRKRRKKIHLVVLTHGLHSNLGADMLFMKECIDTTARQAKEDRKNARRIAKETKAKEQYDFGRTALDQRTKSVPDLVIAPTDTAEESGSNHPEKESDHDDDDDDDDDEEVVVKGFNGNAIKTERGIQFLARTFTGAAKPTQTDGKHPSHKNSSIAKDDSSSEYDLPYKITSISFVGHSLGGLIQTYAVAYIQKHSPEFFDKIKPINFVALASPFLGLSNENPIYVKFALDFGLVGRTGQDLGLTWRAPTIARNGWGAMVGGFNGGDTKDKDKDPAAKPLLRILPTGPAHVALKRFRNRSVYANVVNDGIVPLRTSCLLFLDWRGLGRVEKARRENGIVGTMVNWGLSELTGQNASTPRRGFFDELFSDSGDDTGRPPKPSQDPGLNVPHAEISSGLDNDLSYGSDEDSITRQKRRLSNTQSSNQNVGPNIWSALTSFFRPHAGSQNKIAPKQRRIFERGQTMGGELASNESQPGSEDSGSQDGHSSAPGDHRKLLVRGSSLYTNGSDNDNLDAPPRTTVFESAGDLLNPPLPPKEYLLNPEARPRTIFHDRVYHPDDIPPPPTKRQRTSMRSRPSWGDINAVPNQASDDLEKISTGKNVDQAGMRIEEKIAREYHKGMAWRKVLVRLEPDAHNNIIVRRMFANAYGWPVVKHMCDTHFGYTAAATTRDEDEAPIERAQPKDIPVGESGEEVRDQTQKPVQKDDNHDERPRRATTAESPPTKEDHEIDTLHMRQKHIRARQAVNPQPRTASERGESRDQVSDLVSEVSAQGVPVQGHNSMHSGTAALNRLMRQDSARWSDRFFDSEPEDENEDDEAELNSELQQAYDRGQRRPLTASPASTRSSKKGQHTHSSLGKEASLLDDDASAGLVAEPEEIDMSKMSMQDRLCAIDTQSSPDSRVLSPTGLGLGRNQQTIAEDMHERPMSPSGGITEQVSRARTQSGGQAQSVRPGLGESKQTLD
ncbi:hypothetical protein LTS08_001237 [Lithohypha guttulata]|nr:hypothetical protein LTS08_001237 [Lithohypha guttulata]